MRPPGHPDRWAQYKKATLSFALVGATAIEHRIKLATRDQRALATYRALQVDVEVLNEELAGA